MVRTVLDAATVAEQDGHQLEVVDLRTLSPLDLAPVFDSVRRTGRLICVSEASGEASLIGDLAARVSQECFYSLEAPVLRVTGFDTPYPPAKCEEDYLPDVDRILDAVDRVLAY
jgi:pyruvate dehydrogenase E1 component beta subunit